VPQVPVAIPATPAIVQDNLPVAATPVTPGTGKDSSAKQPAPPSSSASPTQNGAAPVASLPIPIDVTLPRMDMRPPVREAGEESSPRQVESATQPVPSSVPQPEAAVNIVIQTGQTTPVASQSAPQPGPENAPQPVLPVTAPVVPAAAAIPSASIEPDRKKPDVPAISEPQPVTLADAQMKAEPVRAEQHTEANPEAPRTASAAQEPVAPEKAQTTQLKSLSLEFTPDGARDVRVRIAERAGEVHVSLHSNDPGVAKDLRAGAADLGSVLTQAGYDAQTWTSGRQQQNPQQQREEAQQARGNGNQSTENFDGLMTESTETL
jgi:hypothetical protein